MTSLLFNGHFLLFLILDLTKIMLKTYVHIVLFTGARKCNLWVKSVYFFFSKRVVPNICSYTYTMCENAYLYTSLMLVYAAL